MAWPTDDLTTTHYDEGTDDPSQARSELIDLKTKVSSIIAARSQASGVADLDGSGKLPRARLYTATESATGVAELATQSEVDTGTDDARIVTPLKLKSRLDSRSATQTATGLAELATQAEVNAETDDARIVTPAKLGAWFDQLSSGFGLDLLQSASANDVADVTWISGIDSTYDEYLILASNVRPASANVSLYVRVGDSGGGIVSTADYRFNRMVMAPGGAITSAGSTGASQIQVTDGDVGNNRPSSYVFRLHFPAETDFTGLSYETYYLNESNNPFYTTGRGILAELKAVDRIRFLFSAGNINRGEFRLYGVRKS